MAIVTNKDIKMLNDIKDIINKNNIITSNKDKNIYNDYVLFINRIVDIKKQCANKSNAFNKANKEYHRITNNITYAKKTNNIKKLTYWRNKLEEYKENKRS